MAKGSDAMMTSSKPYMFRALFDWIIDNDCTPHVVVNAHCEGVLVPLQYVNKNGEIVLNIAPGAVQSFIAENDSISFSARFSGVPHEIYVPMKGVLGIYARENGRGMMFDHELQPDPPEPPGKDTSKSNSDAPQASEPPSKPGLRLVK
jgi:stringent starvation protein B